MKTCYDCIHCDACSDAGDNGFSSLKEDVSKCKHFKNKADFVEVKHELQILTDTDGEPYMVIAKGNEAKYLVELMRKDEAGTATGRSDT